MLFSTKGIIEFQALLYCVGRSVGLVVSIECRNVVGAFCFSEDASTYSHELMDLARKLDQLEAEAREEDEAERQEIENEKSKDITNNNEETPGTQKATQQITTKKNDPLEQRYPWKSTNFDKKFNGNAYTCKHSLDTSTNREEEIKDSSKSPDLPKTDMYSDSNSMPFTSTPGTQMSSSKYHLPTWRFGLYYYVNGFLA